MQTSPDTARLPRHRGGTGAPPHAHDARDPPATDTRRERRWTVDAVPVGHKRQSAKRKGITINLLILSHLLTPTEVYRKYNCKERLS